MRAFVYIMSNKPHGALYTGVTNHIIRRATEHRNGNVEGFTQKYNCKKLIYVEEHATLQQALQREKNIKFWSRQWKVELVESLNKEWRDLYEDVIASYGTLYS